ncbi:ABC1 family-domain-containing protein [Halteromyces radiatus]|uniref:ABC1 family-domain-containing protein n=1 Tax=Halteromyces radiatus TaxID=101107 RepID=UPI00221F7B09|nr:ABC1 family-domain-containing protein [Halteromyces radiatus]KAI8089403.1 ABC1 family-domain-containing protein [Halteromyces radiatus]
MLRRIPRFAKCMALGGIGFSAIYNMDNRTEAKLLQRSLRTFYNGLILAVDYKLYGGDIQQLPALHERVANRMFNVFEKNGGLYIKIGQVIAAQSAILPTAYQRRAKSLLDSAPEVALSSIEQVFLEDYGTLPQDLFTDFDPHPVASASIAQVHKAVLPSGQVVAVKVQKPAVQKQIGWDLYALRALLHLYEYIFELPLTFTADYIEQHIRKEVDFENEARNGQRSRHHLEQQSQLEGKVYIPKVYPEYSTRRVLVCEWVDGVQLTDMEKITALGLDYKEAMKISIEAFSSQIFISGFVHGDPHAGNVLVAPHPKNKKKVQVILVDHGLYVQESEKFRIQYCKLWQALFMLDLKTMTEICSEWGIHDVNMFASIILQKPFVENKAVHLQQTSLQDIYEFQSGVKERLKHFLEDQQQFPQELIFLLRNMEIVRANNKTVGSPVNRLNIMARWAVRGIDDYDEEANRYHHHRLGLQHQLRATWRRFIFSFNLFLMSLGFWLVKLRQNTSRILFGTKIPGFEELLDQRMKEQMYLQYGIQIDENVFDA